ncbi:MAG: beta-ribofuranosylaminobenzene 5-phosphate synthase [Pirellulaceae bacterium]|nr:MAG: beta-ribofuranosylaminobenzene 5-phosphate synthase [Pirellulaceae bacterium]
MATMRKHVKRQVLDVPAATEAVVRVRTGSRLHFGLWEICPRAAGAYGGLGLMTAHPSLEVMVAVGPRGSAPRFDCPTSLRVRCGDIFERWLSEPGHEGVPVSQITVRTAATLHSGLGTGTQLTCALVSGLQSVATMAAEDLAAGRRTGPHNIPGCGSVRSLIDLTGRGKRSKIGCTGFLHGGLILDHGDSTSGSRQSPAAETVGLTGLAEPRFTAIRFPSVWRAVIILPPNRRPIHGDVERRLFRQLGHNPNPRRQVMQELAENILEAARNEDFPAFCQQLDDYMLLAGQLFSPMQGGIYNGPEVHAAVDAAREVGLAGVGQSSWGPAVFGFTSDQSSAQEAVQRLAETTQWRVFSTTALDGGATVEIECSR